jgi:ubiquinone/menaquinone biosynthesis C-methylase UbiE
MTKASEKHDVERFDRWSHTYEQSWLQRNFFDRVHQAVLSLIASEGMPESILDVGCGTGRLLREARLRWPNAQFIGVDAAEGMVETAQQLTPDATFHVGRAEALPLPDASIDVVLSTMSFHHWHDQAAGLREVARVLRPGGRFFLADISVPALFAKFIRSPQVHTPASLHSLFTQAGLEGVKQQAIFSRFVLVTVGMRQGERK